MPHKPTSPPETTLKGSSQPAWLRWLIKIVLWTTGLAMASVMSILLVIAVALAVAYPNLPDISDLVD